MITNKQKTIMNAICDIVSKTDKVIARGIDNNIIDLKYFYLDTIEIQLNDKVCSREDKIILVDIYKTTTTKSDRYIYINIFYTDKKSGRLGAYDERTFLLNIPCSTYYKTKWEIEDYITDSISSLQKEIQKNPDSVAALIDKHNSHNDAAAALVNYIEIQVHQQG